MQPRASASRGQQYLRIHLPARPRMRGGGGGARAPGRHAAGRAPRPRRCAGRLCHRAIDARELASDGARTDFKRDLLARTATLRSADGARARPFSPASPFAASLARDASNPEWRRDLSVALERIGQVECCAADMMPRALHLPRRCGCGKPLSRTAQATSSQRAISQSC